MIGAGFLSLLIFKVVITALVVVAISVAIKRSGPTVGGVLMGLPITAGPGYVFLALQSSPHFVAQSAFFSFAIVSANLVYIAVYLLAAPRFGPFATVVICLAGWFAIAFIIRAVPTSLWLALGLNLATFVVSLPLIRAPRSSLPRQNRRADWRELLFRAVAAGALVAIVVSASEAVGSSVTGIAMLFPVTLVTIGWVMQSRYGVDEAVSVMTGALIALPGFAVSIMMLYLLAEPIGPPVALTISLLISLSWAATTLWWRRAL